MNLYCSLYILRTYEGYIERFQTENQSLENVAKVIISIDSHGIVAAIGSGWKVLSYDEGEWAKEFKKRLKRV